MELESVKRLLEREGSCESIMDSLPHGFFQPFVFQGLKVDLIERGRIACSMAVPPHLVNTGNSLHGGATAALVDLVGAVVIFTVSPELPVTGVSVEINVSYLDGARVGDEIEIEAKVLRVGKVIAVVSVEFKNKKTGKVIARGRHTKYFAVSSRL